MTTMLTFRHPNNRTYSGENSFMPNSLTYGMATVIIDHPIGRIGRPMQVAIELQDHAGQWHKVCFPHVTMIGAGL
jgi:hypothetical protein